MRPMAALTEVSMMIGCVKPWRRSSRAMVSPSSGSSIMTSRIRRSGLTSATCRRPSVRFDAQPTCETLFFQDELAGLLDVGVVVDDQDLGHLCTPPLDCHGSHDCSRCPVGRSANVGEAPNAPSAPGPVSPCGLFHKTPANGQSSATTRTASGAACNRRRAAIAAERRRLVRGARTTASGSRSPGGVVSSCGAGRRRGARPAVASPTALGVVQRHRERAALARHARRPLASPP